MKIQKSINNKSSLRFRRWSRANYAIFVSLGVCVSIGFLSNSIAEKSVSKTSNTIAEIIESDSKTESDQDDCSPENISITEQLQGILISENLSEYTVAEYIYYFT